MIPGRRVTSKKLSEVMKMMSGVPSDAAAPGARAPFRKVSANWAAWALPSAWMTSTRWAQAV